MSTQNNIKIKAALQKQCWTHLMRVYLKCWWEFYIGLFNALLLMRKTSLNLQPFLCLVPLLTFIPPVIAGYATADQFMSSVELHIVRPGGGLIKMQCDLAVWINEETQMPCCHFTWQRQRRRNDLCVTNSVKTFSKAKTFPLEISHKPFRDTLCLMQ